MRNRLSFIGLFSRIYVDGSLPEYPKERARAKHWTWTDWKHSIRVSIQGHRLDRMEIQKIVFQIPNKWRISWTYCPEESGHSSDQETKKNDSERGRINLKENENYYGISRKLDTSIVKNQCFESWISEEEIWQLYNNFKTQNRGTQSFWFAQFTQQTNSFYGPVSSWSEQLTQWTPDHNELNVEKFVAKANEQLFKNVKSCEVNSLIETPSCNDGTSGNRLREQLRRIGALKEEVHFTRVCEDTTQLLLT